MGNTPRILRRSLAATGVTAALAVLAVGLWIHQRLSDCLPRLEGSVALEGLSSTVRIDRDVRGVPTVHAASRLDAARALGWLHGQDRFFQMDLMRRRAAGELAALIGPKALPLDTATRPFEFRRYAGQAYRALPPGQRAILDAYVAGVNEGLRALDAPPWEYAVLREQPRPWTGPDSLLTGYSMVLVLDDAGRYEASLALLRDLRGRAVTDFFAPLIGPDDDAFDGTRAALPPVPGPGSIDLRLRAAGQAVLRTAGRDAMPLAAGSNAFALSGAYTDHGAGMLANDMHLSLAVPCTWYQAVIDYRASNGRPIRLAGLTLPGSPVLVAGSNGRVAWGLTNSFADTCDLIPLEFLPGSKTRYRTGTGDATLVMHRQTIQVRGAPSVEIDTPWTIWGPVHGHDAQGQPYALAWTAENSRAIDLGFDALAHVGTVAEALAVAQRSGVPTLNFVATDRAGAVGWTIAGPLPRRAGYDGRFPTARSGGGVGWEGWLPPAEHPSVLNPPSGWFSSANERLFGGATLEVLGDGGYETAYRGAQLRADLAPLATRTEPRATPADLLAIQLDDRAVHLERWRQLLLRSLPTAAMAGNPERARLRTLVTRWQGRAVASSVAYTLVRDFRDHVVARVLGPVFEPCVATDPRFEWWKFHYEPAVWRLLGRRPLNLLAPSYANWDDLLLASVDDVIRQDRPLHQAAWGRRNRAHIVHPFAALLPGFLARAISMPEVALDGDRDMPRVTAPSFGASERLVVEPGREEEGILEMPGGVSSNPLSPFFRTGFNAWVEGRPSPLLPGPTRYSLELAPARALLQRSSP